MNIAEIKPYENNPRIVSEKAIDAVAESIKNFGFKVPVIIDKNNTIIAGHTRILAAKISEVKAFRLADNKTAELSVWDFEKLDIELEELENFDMEIFGFNVPDYEEIIKSKEIDTEDFSDGKFKHECPKCGFKF